MATVGVNVSGAEYSWMPFVGVTDLDYLANQGVTLIRLPISWERMQPTLNGPLDPTYLSGLENVLSEAAARGIQVVIDLHNYGRYNLNYAADAAANYGIVAPDAPDSSVIGSSAVPVSAFASFWNALASQLNGHAGLAGYDIMNEPNNMGSSTIWPQAAQAAVDAIRAADMKTPVYVEGYQWASAANWLVYNANLHITDPANKIIYEAHQYFDSNGSGQYAQTYAQQGATPNVGVQDLQPFLSWLQANNYQGFVGELGVPSNDPNWTAVLNNALSQLQAAGVSSTVWNYVYADPSGKNSWWPVTDSLSIDPKAGWGAATMEAIFAHLAPSVLGIFER
ncbi:glycoside hydrolase family 5 protein [Bradyrhizobium sp. LB13.1]